MCRTPPGLPLALGHQPSHLRLEVLVYEDVIAIQLKAVLIADDHLLHTLQAPDEDVVHVTEELLHCLGSVLGCQVLSAALEHPLAALWPQAPGWERKPQLTGTWPARTLKQSPSAGPFVLDKSGPALSPLIRRTPSVPLFMG